MFNLSDDIINKIIMYSIPKYPYLEELKTSRFIRIWCRCEGCRYKQHYGCYEYEFNNPDNGKRGSRGNIIRLWSDQCYNNIENDYDSESESSDDIIETYSNS